MTFQDEIARLQARIAAARAARESAQTAGVQDKYLDASYLLEQLERDLEALRQEGLRAFATHHVMAELGIVLRDGAFCVGEMRYARLEDAVSYARLLRTQGRRAA